VHRNRTKGTGGAVDPPGTMRIVDPVVDTLTNAAREQDREAARLALHPYLHWTERDGQIYRWRC
jgi:hypothetical protein